MEDLKKIIRDCSTGNAKAQEKLYHLFAPKMMGVCLRYSRDRAEAEDSLQDGFIKVFTYIGNFRHEGSFEGWMKRIMVNVALEKFRKKQYLYPVGDIAAYDDQEYAEETMPQISANELLALIQELPPRYQMVFNLYVMEGMKHEEISEELGISEGTSKSNLARARNILKEKVKKLYSSVEQDD